LEKLWSCGRLETYSTARHHLGYYDSVGLTATHIPPSVWDVLIDNLVFAAIIHVVAEHHNLSTVPVDEDKSYPDVCFVHLPVINMENWVEFRTCRFSIPRGDQIDIYLNELLQSQHSCDFKCDVRRSYCRLVVTVFLVDHGASRTSWILHHEPSDGVSAILFHEAFLESLEIFLRAPLKKVGRHVSTPSTPLGPPLENLHNTTDSWPFFLSAVAGSLLPGHLKPRSWTGSPIAQKHISSKTRIVTLSVKTTKAFAALCREKGTSATVALSTLLPFEVQACAGS
ncbi:uncharacterized protein M421DRAFT_65484, partial [Didymella exigua CBS 183.55]